MGYLVVGEVAILGVLLHGVALRRTSFFCRIWPCF